MDWDSRTLVALGVEGELKVGDPAVVLSGSDDWPYYNPLRERRAEMLVEIANAWKVSKGVVGNEIYDYANAIIRYELKQIAQISDERDVAVHAMNSPFCFAIYCLTVREGIIEPEKVLITQFSMVARWWVFDFSHHTVTIPPGLPDIHRVNILAKHLQSDNPTDEVASTLAALDVVNEVTPSDIHHQFFQSTFGPIFERDGGALDPNWLSISGTLEWLAAAVGSGVVGNAAYDAAKSAVRRQIARVRRHRDASDCVMTLNEARAFSEYALIRVKHVRQSTKITFRASSLHSGTWQIEYEIEGTIYGANIPPGEPDIDKIEFVQLDP